MTQQTGQGPKFTLDIEASSSLGMRIPSRERKSPPWASGTLHSVLS